MPWKTFIKAHLGAIAEVDPKNWTTG